MENKVKSLMPKLRQLMKLDCSGFAKRFSQSMTQNVSLNLASFFHVVCTEVVEHVNQTASA